MNKQFFFLNPLFKGFPEATTQRKHIHIYTHKGVRFLFHKHPSKVCKIIQPIFRNKTKIQQLKKKLNEFT